MRRLLLIVFCGLACGLTLAAQQTRYAGRPLANALRDLESRGLRLIYSDDVVRPDMIVKNEPRATEPRRILDELLREHALAEIVVTPGRSRSLRLHRRLRRRNHVHDCSSTAFPSGSAT
jgi:hypothetical protein